MNWITLALAALGLLAAHASHATPGDVDSTFGTGGIATVTTGGVTEAEPRAVAQAPDGSVLLAGAVRQSRRERAAAIVRLRPDGQRDARFGDGGELVLQEFEEALGVATQSGERAVVALREQDLDFDVRPATVLLRLDAMGRPDEGFGDGGRVDVGAHFDQPIDLRALASAPDGRLVALVWYAGASTLLRLDADGGLDPTFGTAGKVDVGFVAHALSVAASGAVLTGTGHTSGLTLLRFDVAGAPDVGFGTGGRLEAGIPVVGSVLVATTTRTDGRVLVAGKYEAFLIEPDGALVETFGDGGRVQIVRRYVEPAVAATLAAGDGFVVARAEAASADPYARAMVATLHDASGAVVPAFGEAGSVRTEVGAPNEDARDLIVGPDARIAIAVQAFNGGRDLDLGLVRLTSDGVPDPDFGSGGAAPLIDATTAHDDLLDRFYTSDETHALVRLQDGRLVVIGQRSDNTIPLARFWPDGTPDGTVGAGTRVIRSFGHDAFVAGALRDRFGRLVLVGGSETPPYDWIARLGTDLAYDASFGGTGTVRGNVALRAVALQSDGRILAAGDGVLRFDESGARDLSFGQGGVAQAVPGVPSGTTTWSKVAVRPNDSFTAVGAADGRILVARYLANGLLDAAFAQAGVARVDGDPLDVAVQADGKLLVLADVAPTGARQRQMVVLRLDHDGRPDAGFGDAGFAALPFHDPVSAASFRGAIERDRVAALASAPDGGILVAGSAFDGRRRRAAVVRLVGDAPSTCGNGAIEPGEDCDDGNLAAGDGCDARCTIEPCFVCRATPSACTPDGLDADGDGACDEIDSCPTGPDAAQRDADGDRIGDACDLCPWTTDPAQADTDSDRRGDACDLCPLERPFFDDSQLRFGAGPGGTGRFVVRARFGYYHQFLDPVRDGFHLVVRDANGNVVLDAEAPPGAYDHVTRSGWLRSGGASPSWRYRAASPAGDAVESVDVKTIANQRVRIAVRGRRASVALPTSLPPSVSAVGRDEEVDLYPTAEQCSGLQLEPRTPASSRDRCTVRGRTLLCRGER